MNNSMNSSEALKPAWEEKSHRSSDDSHAWIMAHLNANGRALEYRPALEEIINDKHRFVVVQKGSQVGLTQAMSNKAIWGAATGYADRGNVGYYLPTGDMADDFAETRLERAIRESELLNSKLRARGGSSFASSRRLKFLGGGYVYIRGSESQRALIGADLDMVFLDEFDRMSADALELAKRRLGSSKQPQLFVASTPILPGAGINELFLASDQRMWHIPCPDCGLEQALTWELNIDIDRKLRVCKECRGAMDVTVHGAWVPQAPENEAIHGYKYSQLYSTDADIARLIENSRSPDIRGQQQFRNMELAEVFSPESAGLSFDILDRNRDEYELDDFAGEECVMGVDVGDQLHVIVRELRPRGKGVSGRLWFAGTTTSFEEVARWESRFNVARTVIDARPEFRAVSEFAKKNRRVRTLAYYTREDRHIRTRDENRHRIVRLGRTLVIDEVVERMKLGNAPLPQNARELGGRLRDGRGEYYRQMVAPRRVEVKNSMDDWAGRWIDNEKADHYAHSEVYAWAAQEVASKSSINTAIRF
jgi:hypothetical protein